MTTTTVDICSRQLSGERALALLPSARVLILPLPSFRQLLYYKDEFGDRGEFVTVSPSLVFPNPRLRTAYIALQAWKEAIFSDPQNLIADWVGFDVCNYTTSISTTATSPGTSRRSSNSSQISDCFTSTRIASAVVPHKFKNLKLLFELDLSNNRFAGKLPQVVLKLSSLKFLDLRFNEFEGNVSKELFDKDLDAIFINHNRFQFELPNNFGNTPVSVIVMANKKFHGCVPASLGNMSKTLNEIILMQNGLRSCLSAETGLLKELTVFDVGFNELMGTLPETIGGMVKLEQWRWWSEIDDKRWRRKKKKKRCCKDGIGFCRDGIGMGNNFLCLEDAPSKSPQRKLLASIFSTLAEDLIENSVHRGDGVRKLFCKSRTFAFQMLKTRVAGLNDFCSLKECKCCLGGWIL
ncbi:unnamed protein product [Camellia sinensis]